MSAETEADFERRLTTVRAWLKSRECPFIESAAPAFGTVYFYLAKKLGDWARNQPPQTARATIVNSRELCVTRPVCKNCGTFWERHTPAGGKCLFSSTVYDHDASYNP